MNGLTDNLTTFKLETHNKVKAEEKGYIPMTWEESRPLAYIDLKIHYSSEYIINVKKVKAIARNGINGIEFDIEYDSLKEAILKECNKRKIPPEVLTRPGTEIIGIKITNSKIRKK